MIELRAILSCRRRRLLLVTLLGMLAAAVLLAHSALGMGHDDEMGMAGGHGTEVSMAFCLTIVEIGVATVAMLAPARPAVPTAWAPALIAPPPELDHRTDWISGSARGSPQVLQVFRT